MTGQKNLKDIKIMNRANVLRMICERPGLTRQDVAAILGLSKMSAVNIVTEYVEKGYVTEKLEGRRNTERANVGRPSLHVSVVPNSVIVMGLYISEMEITCSLINLACEILISRTIIPKTTETNAQLYSAIDGLMEKVLKAAELDSSRLFGIGIAAVGLIDSDSGTILCADNFPHMQDMRIKAHYEEKYGLPVEVSNDMNAAAIAEKHFGNAIDANNFLYVGVSSSIGLGIYINDTIYCGHNGFAGELGYTTIEFQGEEARFGYPGQLESFVRIDRHVARVNRDLENQVPGLPDFPADKQVDWYDIVKEAKLGNAYCIDVIRRIGDFLAIAIVNASNIFDPQKIIIGGQLAAAGSLLLDYVIQQTYNMTVKALLQAHKIRSRYPAAEIVLSSFEERITTIGSGAIVFDALFQGKYSLL